MPNGRNDQHTYHIRGGSEGRHEALPSFGISSNGKSDPHLRSFLMLHIHHRQPHQPLSSSSSFSVIICLSSQHSCHTTPAHIHQSLSAYKFSSMSVAIASSFSNHMGEPWRAAASQRVLPQSVLLLDQTKRCNLYLFMT